MYYLFVNLIILKSMQLKKKLNYSFVHLIILCFNNLITCIVNNYVYNQIIIMVAVKYK